LSCSEAGLKSEEPKIVWQNESCADFFVKQMLTENQRLSDIPAALDFQ
jgi:hypothetical protein